jgi:hypothetical protein
MIVLEVLWVLSWLAMGYSLLQFCEEEVRRERKRYRVW